MKLNVMLLLVALAAFGSSTFCREDGQPDNTGIDHNDARGDDADDADNADDANEAPRQPARTDAPPADDREEAPATPPVFLTRNRKVALVGITAAAAYLVYKYFAGRKAQEQDAENIIID